jgi:hypothetical protein
MGGGAHQCECLLWRVEQREQHPHDVVCVLGPVVRGSSLLVPPFLLLGSRVQSVQLGRRDVRLQ